MHNVEIFELLNYQPQGKVMFSEACGSHSVHGGGGEQTLSGGRSPSLEADPLTSSGGHYSGRYASYRNAFLFRI